MAATWRQHRCQHGHVGLFRVFFRQASVIFRTPNEVKEKHVDFDVADLLPVLPWFGTLCMFTYGWPYVDMHLFSTLARSCCRLFRQIFRKASIIFRNPHKTNGLTWGHVGDMLGDMLHLKFDNFSLKGPDFSMATSMPTWPCWPLPPNLP